jgi:hypothetical protein
MKKSELKQIIRECLEEVINEGGGARKNKKIRRPYIHGDMDTIRRRVNTPDRRDWEDPLDREPEYETIPARTVKVHPSVSRLRDKNKVKYGIGTVGAVLQNKRNR